MSNSDRTVVATLARRPKGDKRQRTRAALIDAAAALVAERGYEQTRLEDVAARAGMSRGAIYGNFKDRDDLFLEVVRAKWTPIAAPLQPELTLRDQMRFAGAFAYRAARARRGQAAAAMAFRLYLLEHEDMRSRIAAENKGLFDRAAAALAAIYPPSALPMPVDDFVRAAFAMTEGLVFAHFADPAAFPERVFAAALEALAT